MMHFRPQIVYIHCHRVNNRSKEYWNLKTKHSLKAKADSNLS